jgi:hypothetical protein
MEDRAPKRINLPRFSDINEANRITEIRHIAVKIIKPQTGFCAKYMTIKPLFSAEKYY